MRAVGWPSELKRPNGAAAATIKDGLPHSTVCGCKAG